MSSRRTAWIAAAAALGAVGCVGAPSASARDATVRSFDGTAILANFSPALDTQPGARAPTVLVGPGYPNPGDTRPDADTSDTIGQATLRAAGYNVLTWDPRGIGGSGGVVAWDAPGREGRDVRALIGWVAAQPEALLDAPGDPRVGLSGSSYGGAIQLAAAAIDRRVDALVPDVTWSELARAFFPEGNPKATAAALLCARGETGRGLLGPGAAALVRVDPHVASACRDSRRGAVSAANRSWFAQRTPPDVLRHVAVPTLLTQGTVDVLFGLDQAATTFHALRERGVPTKMLWYCGGHGICATPPGEAGHVRRAALAWLARWLKRDTTARTGAPFEWLADDGVWRSGPRYPLPSAGTLRGVGGAPRRLSLTGPPSGSPVAAAPASRAVSVAFAARPAESDVVGAPTLELTYRGTARPRRTFLYAQIVTAGARRVAGAQATPLPVVLDGRTRTVRRELAPIAAHLRAGTRYQLQLVPATRLFLAPRAVGSVLLSRIDAGLPLVSARGPATSRSG